MSNIDRRLDALIAQVGSNASEEQSDSVVSFITHNYPKHLWACAADKAIDVGDVYTDITERLGECGMF
jgi:hypothetical protein